MPNMCATIPLVAGTVDSHKKPKVAPKIKALRLLGGRNINKTIDIIISNNLVEGTTKNDFLNGSSGDDIINGSEGNDIINASNGSDSIDGGAGIVLSLIHI